ncbi:hypothetical protein ES332_D04G213500v1 [Gossypium tomentosum]|uniref:Uncharacterized protein n=1 Tax=Gossypium tomentosum TaxID=34277 RepID=A0A5D2LFT0_GOSTO|nr:hypothetical protein ES332_D04G213500v1 [Gossypium tomentosum]
MGSGFNGGNEEPCTPFRPDSDDGEWTPSTEPQSDLGTWQGQLAVLVQRRLPRAVGVLTPHMGQRRKGALGFILLLKFV